MKNYLLLLLPVFLYACGQNKNSDQQVAKAPSNAQVLAASQASTSTTATTSAEDAAIAIIDVNGVLVKLHKLIKFEPKGNQFLKADNSKFNYYVMDVSLTNNTTGIAEGGKDFCFWVDIESKDGKRFQKIDPSVKALTLYKMEIADVAQKDYDKIWSKLQAGENVRSIVKGFEVPKDMVPAKFVYYHPGTGVHKEQALN